jgi:hypothetical protein
MLFEALKNLIRDGIIDPDRVEVRFFGSQDPWLFDDIRDANLDGIVKVFGFIPRPAPRNSVSHSSTVALWKTHRNGECTPKVFEYLAAGRPIIR